MISHSKKFIFVPIRKGAGTSLLEALRPFVESGDVQTYNRGVMSNGLGKNGIDYGKWSNRPKDYAVVTVCRNPWTRFASSFRIFRNAKRNKRGGYDWLPKEPTLRELIENLPTREEDEKIWFHTQCSVSAIVTLNEKFIADIVLRFERLQEDFNKLCHRFNLGNVVLPKRSFSGTTPEGHAALYDDYSRQWVAEKYADDIERFGYTFPGDGYV